MNSISILIIDTQAQQVEGMFSLPEMPFFHDYIVMTMGLSVMSSLATSTILLNTSCRQL